MSSATPAFASAAVTLAMPSSSAVSIAATTFCAALPVQLLYASRYACGAWCGSWMLW